MSFRQVSPLDGRESDTPGSSLSDCRKECWKMKSLLDSMAVYWCILLLFSLGAAGLIYIFWLKDALI